MCRSSSRDGTLNKDEEVGENRRWLREGVISGVGD